MVSKGSSCDSDGITAYMQGTVDEEGLLDVESRREVEEYPILVAPSKGLTEAAADKLNIGSFSSSGGIPLEEEVLADDMDVNREERRELIALKQKMIEIQHYLLNNGLSMADFEKQAMADKTNFNERFNNPASFISGRDEFGLPNLKKSDGFDNGVGCSDG